jgi:hypothetical protein
MPPLLVPLLLLLLPPPPIFVRFKATAIPLPLPPFLPLLRLRGGRLFGGRDTDTVPPSLPQAEERVGTGHVQVVQHEVVAVRGGHLAREEYELTRGGGFIAYDTVKPLLPSLHFVFWQKLFTFCFPSSSPHSPPRLRLTRTMLPLFEFAGDLVTEPVSFEEELKANESLSLENMRALSRCDTHHVMSHPGSGPSPPSPRPHGVPS